MMTLLPGQALVQPSAVTWRRPRWSLAMVPMRKSTVAIPILEVAVSTGTSPVEVRLKLPMVTCPLYVMARERALVNGLGNGDCGIFVLIMTGPGDGGLG